MGEGRRHHQGGGLGSTGTEECGSFVLSAPPASALPLGSLALTFSPETPDRTGG